MRAGSLTRMITFLWHAAVAGLIAVDVWQVQHIHELEIFAARGDRNTKHMGEMRDRRVVVNATRMDNLEARLDRLDGHWNQRMSRVENKLDKLAQTRPTQQGWFARPVTNSPATYVMGRR